MEDQRSTWLTPQPLKNNLFEKQPRRGGVAEDLSSRVFMGGA